MGEQIVIQAVGPVPYSLFEWLPEHIEAVLKRPVETAPDVPLPQDGYDPERKQYRGAAILDALDPARFPQAERLLGFVDADCYAPFLNFIFGQAAPRQRKAFVALARLKPSFYGLLSDEAIFQRRTLVEAVHELGHTYGLEHCPNPDCVMYFSNSMPETDRKGPDFCPACRI